jgi:quercetin dioxygenase-like cupin family protein
MAQTMATIQRKSGDYSMEALHESEREWETLRFPGQWSKMLFHPRPERPTEPNAGFVRYEPGAHHPMHRHDFAQVWYILEGTFTIGEKIYEPGTMIYHADPHYEEQLSTETGGVMLFVQYQGPTTNGRPIYDGRFNVAARKPVSEEQLDV